MQIVREADRAAAQIPVCRMCGEPSPNGDPCESCKVKSMNKSEIAERATAIGYLRRLHSERGTMSPNGVLLAMIATDIEEGLKSRQSQEDLDFQLRRLAIIMVNWSRSAEA